MSGNALARARAKASLERPVYRLRVPNEEWDRMDEVSKIKALFGMSLDDVHELMSIPMREADLHERSQKLLVFQTLMKTGLSLLDRRDRDQFQAQVLGQLKEAFGALAAGVVISGDRVDVNGDGG